MPSAYSLHALLGAAVLGVIGAASMFLVQHYRYQSHTHQMAKDLARLDQELAQVRKELDRLLVKKREKGQKTKKSRTANRANSIISTTDDYLSAANVDSSDMEFYDLSDSEETSNTNLESVILEIDRKVDNSTLSELEKILEKLEDLCIEFPENADLLWRIGKVHQKIADKSDDSDFIQGHINKGIDACHLALVLKPDCAEIHKWYAILIGSRNDFVSLQEKISDGHLFKKHVDVALSLSPLDPSLHHMRGRFDFEVAGLKWYERKVASALFAEPPKATYAEALSHFMEAEKLANFEWKENKLMIAKCKIAEGAHQEAVEWLEKANSCKQGDGLDDKVDSEVKVLLEKYNSYR